MKRALLYFGLFVLACAVIFGGMFLMSLGAIAR